MSASGAFVDAAEAEVQPRCRHFGVCGGCDLQHLAQAMQLSSKWQSVAALLQRAGVVAPPITSHAAQEYGYRNRIRLRVVDGHVGYSRRASHEFLPISECPIAAPLLWSTAERLGVLARAGNLWPQGTAEVELAADSSDTALQMLLHVDATVASLDRDAPTRFRALCTALAGSVPQLRGAGLLVRGELPANSRRVQERQRIEVARWGTPELTFTVDAAHYRVSRGAFFQVNRFLTARMVELVIGERAGRLAWDLFAGSGLFSVPLTRRFDRVIAVEIGQPAATDLSTALQACGPQHLAVARPTLDFLRAQSAATAPDLIVMDPPRAGLGSGITTQLARIGAPELVYVSCDAASFARDARSLVDSRYAVAELHGLDLFPQTNHTETIAVFRRS